MQGVDKPIEQVQDPSEEAVRMVSRLNEAKQVLMDNMKEFNKVLNINVLAENKSIKEKEYEQLVVNNLVKSALNVEELNRSEGLLALCVLAIRQGLSLRDAGNRLAYQVDKLNGEIQELKNNTNNENPSPEELVLEQARKLGVKIKVEK